MLINGVQTLKVKVAAVRDVIAACFVCKFIQSFYIMRTGRCYMYEYGNSGLYIKKSKL